MKYLLLFIVLIAPCVSSASAEYLVTPPIIELNVSARDLQEETIKVTNTGTVPLRLFPTVNSVTLGIDGEIATFLPPSMANQADTVTSWLAISRARLELAPGETKKIPLNITISPNATPGDYYAFVGFGNGDKRDEVEASVLKGTVPGVVVRVSIADTATEYLRLHGFTVDRFVRSGEAVAVRYELENIGDTPVTPAGEVILYDVRGAEVGAIAVNTESVTLAPGERKAFSTTAPDTGSFGRHKAFLSLEYGQKQRANLYDTTFFTVIPITLLITAFVLLLAVSLLLTLLHLRRQKAGTPTVDDEAVSMYIRTGELSNKKDHDIILTKK
jgi:uncharacterized membrane protein